MAGRPAGPKDYLCVVPCWHMGTRYRKGQTVKFREDQLPRNKQGEMVHFQLMSPSSPPPVVENGPVIVNEKMRPEK